MTDVTVFLAKALICFAGACHPVLIGDHTPLGTYQLEQREVLSPGYGGDVLVFDENDTTWWGIHRTYKNLPKRVAAYDLPAAQRQHITAGCINVEPPVYTELVNCCSAAQLEVLP